MVRTAALCLLLLSLAGCAVPTPRVPRPGGDPLAGLAPPPPPAPAQFAWSGPFGPWERGDPPVVIVPASDSDEVPEIRPWPEFEGRGNVYGFDAPYGTGYRSDRRR